MLVLASRYGFKQPSGMSATHEEYGRAEGITRVTHHPLPRRNMGQSEGGMEPAYRMRGMRLLQQVRERVS